MIDLVKDGEPRDFQLEAESRELNRLIALRKLLEPAAEVFTEMAPKGCHGECGDPVKIGVLGMTCCNFYAHFEHYNSTMRLELTQRNIVEATRDKHRRPTSHREIEGSMLQERYPRDFTGTYVLRKMDLRSDEGSPEPAAPRPSRLPELAFDLDPDHLHETLKKLG